MKFEIKGLAEKMRELEAKREQMVRDATAKVVEEMARDIHEQMAADMAYLSAVYHADSSEANTDTWNGLTIDAHAAGTEGGERE